MFQIQLKRLLRSRTFFLAGVISLAVILIPAVITILKAQGCWSNELFPAYYAFSGTFAGYEIYNAVLGNYLAIFLGVFATLPFSFSFYDDRADGTISAVFSRTGRKAYFRSGMTVSFLSAFCVTVIPLLLAQALFMIALPLDTMTLVIFQEADTPELVTQGLQYGKEFFFASPYLFLALHSVGAGLYAGCVAMTAFLVPTAIFKNRFLTVLAPAMILMVKDILLEFLNLNSWTTFCVFAPLAAHGRGLFFGVVPMILLFAVPIVASVVLWRRATKKNADLL